MYPVDLSSFNGLSNLTLGLPERDLIIVAVVLPIFHVNREIWLKVMQFCSDAGARNEQ